MKNLLVVISIMAYMCGFNACVSLGPLESLGSLDYPEPEFGNLSVYVIDTFKEEGAIKHYVKFYNRSKDSNFDFNFYMHHPGTHEWILYSTVFLKYTGDVDTITFEGLDRYRYFAIEPLSGKEHRYHFFKSSNDLHINVLDY